MKREDEYVPERMGPKVEERLTEFLRWINSYGGPGEPIGQPGLRRLRDFIQEHVSHVGEGGSPWIELVNAPDLKRTGVSWLELELRSLDGREWGVVSYVLLGYNENLWVEVAAQRISDRAPLHIVRSTEEMARIPIDAFLGTLARSFTIAAQKVQGDHAGKLIFTWAWEQQRGLLRMAAAFEMALILLRNKSQPAAA